MSESVVPKSVTQLIASLRSAIVPVAEKEEVPLGAALGRVLAEDVVAGTPVPGFVRSAVDGYALAGPAPDGAWLPVVGRVAAGDDPSGLRCDDGAVRIFTGAALPSDADRVVMQEDCEAQERMVRVMASPAPGAGVRRADDDLAVGETALAAGCRLDPRHLGVAASLGRARLVVRRRLRVATLATGDELVAPGRPLPPGRIHDSAGPMLAGMLTAFGAEPVDLGCAADDPQALVRRLREAEGCDAIISIGGVSVGEEDHVRAALEAAGGRLDHWRVAIKPGRPLAIGRTRSGALFLGLPGNPNSVFVTLVLIGFPLLRTLAGARDPVPLPIEVEAEDVITRTPGRTEYIPVGVVGGRARRLGSGGSGQLSALARADALMVVPAGTADAGAGQRFAALPLAGLIG